jgi:hypothetical protein
MPSVGVLYFDPFSPFKYSLLPFYLLLNTHPYILYLYILWYVILLMLYHLPVSPSSVE